MKILTSKFLLIPLIVVLLAGYYLFFVRSASYDVTGADALTVRVGAGLTGPERAVSAEDLEAVKRILGKGTGLLDDSKCLCVGVDLVFIVDGAETVLFPAGDDSGSIRFTHNGGDYYFHLDAENKAALREILERYGVVWPFGV